jgi:deazaflavin-dependent oxidoreductase (nitroreductase family)
MAIAYQNGQRRFLNGVRHFNKVSFNRLTLMFAGRYLYAAVHHVGRRTGHAYITPVVAFPISEGFITTLPFGAATDWCRNVLAAGKCTIQWRGVTYPVTKPEVVAAATAHTLLPAWAQVLLRLIPIHQFLKVHQIGAL